MAKYLNTVQKFQHWKINDTTAAPYSAEALPLESKFGKWQYVCVSVLSVVYDNDNIITNQFGKMFLEAMQNKAQEV